MAIESKVTYKGLLAATAYSRTGTATINTQTGAVQIQVRDWATKEAAAKVLDKKMVGEPYDPNNPDHVAQWAANGGTDADGKPVPYNPLDLDAHGNPWQPTVAIMVWDGSKTLEAPLQERSIDLPLELSLAVAAMAVPGKNPASASDDMRSQLYRAAMASGEFVDAVAV